MGESETVRETEFDSSVATLQRIDSLIKMLHRAILGDLESKNPYVTYIQVLDRLYLEGQVKMSKDELEECENHQKGLGLLYNKWKNDYTDKNSKNYLSAWSEIKKRARLYEIYIMKCLDTHNMLMRDKKDVMSKFRGM